MSEPLYSLPPIQRDENNQIIDDSSEYIKPVVCKQVVKLVCRIEENKEQFINLENELHNSDVNLPSQHIEDNLLATDEDNIPLEVVRQERRSNETNDSLLNDNSENQEVINNDTYEHHISFPRRRYAFIADENDEIVLTEKIPSQPDKEEQLKYINSQDDEDVDDSIYQNSDYDDMTSDDDCDYAFTEEEEKDVSNENIIEKNKNDQTEDELFILSQHVTESNQRNFIKRFSPDINKKIESLLILKFLHSTKINEF